MHNEWFLSNGTIAALFAITFTSLSEAEGHLNIISSLSKKASKFER